ncbi:MAG: alanine racemase [Dysgonamonadaceae bacterium]|jgi:alanine racemase|nr:alanine racemase [Dysgonamonadaceae bacterium]
MMNQLTEKTNETVLEVDLGAILHNLNYFRSFLKPETKMLCMIKAFGYGTGSYGLGRFLQQQGVDYLAVANVDEGVELREAGITSPIIVMNPTPNALPLLFENNLEPGIYSFDILRRTLAEAEKRGLTDYPVHVKLNTGMQRMGFNPDELPMLLETLKNRKSLLVSSVFSHLAGSDSPEFDDYTRGQIAAFTEAAATMEAALGYRFMRHILNSSGIERFPEAQFDMVRLGIGLYGISPLHPEALQPVARFKTKILQIREVPAAETVGYSRRGVLTRNSRIGCLPVGYADGLNRHLGNRKGAAIVNGKKCPFIGNICMDLTMLDLTDVEARPGDEAEIFGGEITISDIAETLQTIPYEVLTSVSARVRRVYVNG